MKAVVLAAGEGRRLASLNLNAPKPMAPLDGRPLLEYTLALLRHHHFSEVAINLYYRGEEIRTYFGDGTLFGVKLSYLVEPSLSGTAGAVRQLSSFFGRDPFLVIYGDLLTDVDLSRLFQKHRQRRAVATLALRRLDDPFRRGAVDVSPDNWVRGFAEKPGVTTWQWSNAGIYVLEPDVIDSIPAGTTCDFGQDVFPTLISAGCAIAAEPVSGYLRDIGEPEEYVTAANDIKKGECKTYVDR